VTTTDFGPYPGVVRDWHDGLGDTCHVDLDLGFFESLRAYDIAGKPRVSCRIFGINAPELSTAAGKAALAYAETLCPAGTSVTVVSHGLDKYGGRFDGSITLPSGADFAQAMLAAGQAVVMAG
jgi:endonuclease YncB( thermonuclease family)